MKNNTWICRAWIETKENGWTSDFYRFATKEEAEEFGIMHLEMIDYDEENRSYEVYEDADKEQETTEDAMERLEREASRYDEDDLQAFIDETGWEPWMNEYTAAGDAEEISEREEREINRILEQIFKRAHNRKWYAVQETSSDAWDNGSYDYGEAVGMLRRQGRGLIAIIEKDDAGAPICTGEILFDEIC